MGRRNKCKTPLTKQENRLKKDGRLSITGVGQSTQYFPAKAGDAHAHDLTAFRGGASYFDTPMGYIFPRLLCSFPKAKLVHTTRRDYHRGYDGSSRKCRSKREYRLESDLARCIEYGSTCPTRDEAARAFAVNERAMLSVPKSRRHIMNISNLSSIHAGPLAEFLGKEWRWGNPDKPIPHKAVYYASRACLGGNHPRHWVPRVH